MTPILKDIFFFLFCVFPPLSLRQHWDCDILIFCSFLFFLFSVYTLVVAYLSASQSATLVCFFHLARSSWKKGLPAYQKWKSAWGMTVSFTSSVIKYAFFRSPALESARGCPASASASASANVLLLWITSLFLLLALSYHWVTDWLISYLLFSSSFFSFSPGLNSGRLAYVRTYPACI